MVNQNIKITMAQIDVDPGKPKKNADNMIRCIEKAASDNSDIVVFPEMSIPGYMIGDMWERNEFLSQCATAEKRILKASALYPELVIVFGNIDVDAKLKNEDGRVRKTNVCVVVKNGWVRIKTSKSLMPNYRGFDDSRHFFDTRKQIFNDLINDVKTPFGNKQDVESYYANEMLNYFKTITIKGSKVGFMLCEDGWDTDYEFKPISMYTQCDLIVNISCSPYTFEKNNKRNRVFSKHAIENKCAMAYINCVGVQNIAKTIFTFDGNSCIYDKNGDQLNHYPAFEEGCQTFDLDLDSSFGDKNFNKDKETIADLYKAVRYGTKKFMEQQGIKKVVIGASGGMDSCLSAAIYADIISPENLYLVNMPYKYNSKTTIGIAEQLAKNIGCNYLSIPIGSTVDAIKVAMDGVKQHGELTEFMLENVQARARLQTLATFTSIVGGVFTCNSNKSESTIGYCTFYGDLSGWLANLADLWKTQIYEMAKWYNSSIKDIIPEGAFTVMPSAELSPNQNVDEGKGDPLFYPFHDQLFKAWMENWNRKTPAELIVAYNNGTICNELGFPDVYKLFPTIEAFVNDSNRWWNLHAGLAIIKRVQFPPVLCVSRRSYGFDLRESIIKP